MDDDAWKSFSERHPEFASDPRNVRFELTSNRLNSLGNISTSNNSWPIIVISYNLPQLCMKQLSFILALIIPGPTSPGIKIDVYLKPLIT